MGCVKSKPRSLPSGNEVGDHDSSQTEKTKTCCWTGIRKLFSKSKRVMECDIDNDNDDDEVDFTLVNDSNKSFAATTIEPRALHRSWSAPALLGQECEEATVPALSSKVEDQLPSASYPKEVNVSFQCFLSDNTDNECSIDQKEEEEEEEEEVELEEKEQEKEQEGQKEDDQVEEMTIVTSQDDGGVDGIEVMFVISLIRTFIINAIYGVYQAGHQFVYNIVKEEDDDEMDVDEEGAIILGETGDCPPPGNPERYSDFTSNFWAYIRNAFRACYCAGFQFVQDTMMGEEEDGTDVDQGWTMIGTDETGDRTPSGGPWRYLNFASNFWAFIHHVHDSIKTGVFQFFSDIVKEVERSVVGTGATPHQGHPESDVESDVDTDDETDPNQPSTSYRRDKTVNYDFVAWRLLLDSDSEDDDW